ncbi:hypothetical protein ROZALSC1DRAFT_30149 [Rozella allomycis CSF55]|uniref:BRCT domain-containing protein n=1 Tax=Rozella allomycis (strain CSF55) TaxID=988480 RepID=A0A075B3C0_ROZAC|nr:hypothetical protein O9G_000704 [Rozella allomycis CSF55]RKP18118.1 hypothetical protein ROZALSC1DRAFT_30149 [Rozella allomycis CSF55]|eukprot:EPZ35308.1 hypothetical protein O9G_000704 [Rozella allomycis CSF55]
MELLEWPGYFYISNRTDRQFVTLLKDYGVPITRNLEKADFVLAEKDQNYEGQKVIKPSYITDCIKDGTVLEINDYVVKEDKNEFSKQSNSQMSTVTDIEDTRMEQMLASQIQKVTPPTTQSDEDEITEFSNTITSLCEKYKKSVECIFSVVVNCSGDIYTAELCLAGKQLPPWNKEMDDIIKHGYDVSHFQLLKMEKTLEEIRERVEFLSDLDLLNLRWFQAWVLPIALLFSFEYH